MDHKTIKQYDEHSESYVAEWTAKVPKALYEMIEKWFLPKGHVLDVGSGSGRDVEWLCRHGFQAVGVDASIGLLEQARGRWPDRVFHHDSLPLLQSIGDQSFDCLLAAAVLMHLPEHEIESSIKSLLRVIKPQGRIICSVRNSRNENAREGDGRLFTSLDLQQLSCSFQRFGGRVLEEHEHEIQTDGRRWLTLAIEKSL